MTRIGQLVTIAALAALAIGGATGDASAATKKKGLWGSSCSELAEKDRNMCCLNLLRSCILECEGYEKDALKLCEHKCQKKHRTCMEEVKKAATSAPGGTGTVFDQRTRGRSEGESSGGKWKVTPGNKLERR